MRDYILLYINGQRHSVRGGDAFLTLSDFLRQRLGQTGTKIVCSEGDCGSCTVLCGSPNDDKFDYLPIDSCIRFVFQLDGTHVVSVEGVAGPPATQRPHDSLSLTEVQTQMVDCHGSQCGFCTPGFVMAMTGLLENGNRLTDVDLRSGLTGNLCRCTGYTPIIDAGRRCEPGQVSGLNELYRPQPMLADFSKHKDDLIGIETTDPINPSQPKRHVFSPTSIDDVLQLLSEHSDARLVAGATDVGVQINKGRPHPPAWIDLNRVRELQGVTLTDQSIVAGSRATWTEIEAVTLTIAPEFHAIVSVFGSPQIRHVGTLGGNIVNASPIADSIPFLYVCDAELEIAGPNGQRRVNINDFYQGYKQYDLRSNEILTAVHIPLPPADRHLRLYKVSRRRDLDISSFTAAIWVDLDGDTIADVGIAYGAVGPIVIRLRKTEAFLRGKPFHSQSWQRAGDIAVTEITPISDVRGSVDYRLQLARNVLQKFFLQTNSVQQA